MSNKNRESIAHIVALAHLEITEEELDHMAQEIPIILNSIARISEVVDDTVLATSHPLAMFNVSREDVIKPSLTQEQALSGAPAVEDGRFKVPAILDGQ